VIYCGALDEVNLCICDACSRVPQVRPNRGDTCGSLEQIACSASPPIFGTDPTPPILEQIRPSAFSHGGGGRETRVAIAVIICKI